MLAERDGCFSEDKKLESASEQALVLLFRMIRIERKSKTSVCQGSR